MVLMENNLRETFFFVVEETYVDNAPIGFISDLCRNKVKVTERGQDEKTWMDAISVNLFDPLSPQMRMDGGIPDVLIGRWMSVQLWL